MLTIPRISGLLLLALCSALHTSQAQDAKKLNPAPDQSAEAYVAEESSDHWSFENDGTFTRESMARVRIQSDAGVQRFGLLTFAYQKSNETAEIDYVRVRKPDGSVILTPLDDVQDMPSNTAREAPMYSDSREKHVPVKGLSVGDILEYHCHWRQTKPLAPGQFWLSIALTHDEINLKEQVEISVPRDRAVKFKSPGLAPTISETGPRRIYTWVNSNLERKKTPVIDLTQLAYRGRFPVPDIQVSTFQSWEELGRWYDGLQRERLAPSPEIRAKALELTRGAADDMAKIRAIYKYVGAQFRYIGVDFGIGRYQPHFAAEVLSNQYGDCKDKHTLLASLLAAVSIPSYPGLIALARAVDVEVPSPAQFDHVITAVPRGAEMIWLDTTTEVAPFGYLVPRLRDKRALVVYSGKPPEFQTTPADLPFPSSWIFKIDAKLDDSGTLEGKVEQTIRGDNELGLRLALRSVSRAQWKDLIQNFSYAIGFAGEVSDVISSLPEATDTPLHFSYTYKRKEYPDWKEHRISPPAPEAIHAPAEEDGKLPTSFWLGSPGEFVFESRVELPAGYSAEPPGKKDLLMQDLVEYHSTYEAHGNVLAAHYRVLLKGREALGTSVKDYKVFAEKVAEDRSQFIAVSSGKIESEFEASAKIRNRVLELPDSNNPKALQLEQEARAALPQGSFQGAIDGLNRAVALDPKFTRAWTLLGELYLLSMRQEASVDALRKAVESDPKQSVTHLILAFTLVSLGRRAEAIGVWRDLEKVAPDDRDIPTNLGILLTDEKRYREAQPYLEAAVKRFPDKATPLLALGRVYLLNGDEDKAITSFETAMQLEPGAGAKNSVAYLLATSDKKMENALRYSQDAVREEEEASQQVRLSALSDLDLQHTPRLSAYWDSLGWVHFRLGNLKQAENYLYASWLIQPSPVTGYHLGQVYEKLQRKQDAAHMYRIVADQQTRESEGAEAVTGAKLRLSHLGTLSASGVKLSSRNRAADELGENRTVWLPKLVTEHANAEFFLLFAPGAKLPETKFISGSDKLQSAGKALEKAHFKVSFPENSLARLVRRGILACYPMTGCSFVLLPVEATRAAE